MAPVHLIEDLQASTTQICLLFGLQRLTCLQFVSIEVELFRDRVDTLQVLELGCRIYCDLVTDSSARAVSVHASAGVILQLSCLYRPLCGAPLLKEQAQKVGVAVSSRPTQLWLLSGQIKDSTSYIMEITKVYKDHAFRLQEPFPFFS